MRPRRPLFRGEGEAPHTVRLAASIGTCPISGIQFFAYQAARARAARMLERLLQFEHLADYERDEIRAYAQAVADPDSSCARPHRGAPALRGWFAAQHYAPMQYESFKRNYLRFIDKVRRDPRRPGALRAVLPSCCP